MIVQGTPDILTPPTGPISGAWGNLGAVVVNEFATDTGASPLFGGDIPLDLPTRSVDDKVSVYNELLDSGNTDAAIRDRAEYLFGPQTDENWGALQALAAQQRDADADAAAMQALQAEIAAEQSQRDAAAAAAAAAEQARRDAAAAAAAAANAEAEQERAKALEIAAQEQLMRERADAQAAADAAEEARRQAESQEQQRRAEEAFWAEAGRRSQLDVATRLKASDIPDDLPSQTADTKAAIYNMLIAEGNTNAAIRARAEYMFGPQADADWNALISLANAQLEAIAAEEAAKRARAEASAAAAAAAEDARRRAAAAAEQAQRDSNAAAAAAAEQAKRDAAAAAAAAAEQARRAAAEAAAADEARRRATGMPSNLIGGDIPADLPARSAQEKAAIYNQLIAAGNPDAAIRARAEYLFGPQTDAMWGALRDLAQSLKTATGVTPQPAGAGIGPLLLAVAAAAIIGG